MLLWKPCGGNGQRPMKPSGASGPLPWIPSGEKSRRGGLATSGRVAYNPYGSGYYGALASNYAADLSFRCDVDYRGYVRNVDINRR